MKKLIICMSIILSSISSFFLPLNKDDSYITTNASISCSAKGMCVMEKDSKRVLFEQNMNQKLPMASTTKIMTAITTIQNCNDLDQYIQVDDHAIGVEGTSIYLKKGELIKVRDLLYGLMLRSGNDAATALAYHVAGDNHAFADMMNQLAGKIGANSSHFSNPHGLDEKDHYTTAHDLATITAYALNNPIFKEIVSTKQHTIPETNVSDKRYLTNKNKLLNSLEGCCGVKTGYTSKAGRCLVSATERDNMTVVCVVLNCGPMFEESTSLINSAFENYTNKKIIDKNKEIYNEYIIDDKYGKLYLYTDEDYYYPITGNEYVEFTIEYNATLRDVEANQEAGEIKIFFQNDLKKTLKLYTINKIDKFIDNNTLNFNQIIWEDKLNED